MNNTNVVKYLAEADIQVSTDTIGVDHLRFQRQFRLGAARFALAQSLIARQPNNREGVRVGRLICFDMVRPADLPAVTRTAPYVIDGAACVEWRAGDDKRTDRRRLSRLSVLCPWEVNPDPSAELASLASMLEEIPEYKTIELTQRIHQLDLDLACWAASNLPMALWAHVVGLRPLSALSRSTLGVEASGLVPKASMVEQRCSDHAEAADMVDQAIATARKATTQAIVSLAADVLTMKAGESPAETIERWTRHMLALRPQVQFSDVPTGVVVGWLLDLVESGTVTDVDAKCSTRARYGRVAAIRFWRMLAGFPVETSQWKPSILAAGYLTLMADPSCSDLAGLGAAISSLQAYLQDIFGLPALALGLHKLIPEPIPRAQWVSDRAVARAVGWLDQAESGDPRMKQICTLHILIGKAVPVRLFELRWIRLCNVTQCTDGTLEIEITPLSGTAGLKTDAAQRRVIVTDPEVVARVVSWIATRQAEGAPEESLLFAAPPDDMKPYRPYAVHVTLLRVLKQVTGDADMTFHSLRHTCISNAMEVILGSSATSDFNRMTHLADRAGHVVTATTLIFYTHRFEAALRGHLDRALVVDVVLENRDGQCLLGIKSNTLTVGAARSGETVSDRIWRLANDRAQAMLSSLPPVTEGAEWHEPPAIFFTGPLIRSFTVASCFEVMRMLENGIDRNIIENRLYLSRSELVSIEGAAVSVVAEIYKARKQLPDDLVGVKAVFDYLEIDVSRADQPRYDSFRAELAIPLDSLLVQDAARAWTSSWWKGYLSADPPSRLMPILKLLKVTGVDPAALVIRIEDDDKSPGKVAALEMEAKAVATAVFNDHIIFQHPKFERRGRFDAYLVWPSSIDAGSAGRSNRGFDALMFAAAVWSQPSVQGWV